MNTIRVQLMQGGIVIYEAYLYTENELRRLLEHLECDQMDIDLVMQDVE